MNTLSDLLRQRDEIVTKLNNNNSLMSSLYVQNAEQTHDSERPVYEFNEEMFNEDAQLYAQLEEEEAKLVNSFAYLSDRINRLNSVITINYRGRDITLSYAIALVARLQVKLDRLAQHRTQAQNSRRYSKTQRVLVKLPEIIRAYDEVNTEIRNLSTLISYANNTVDITNL